MYRKPLETPSLLQATHISVIKQLPGLVWFMNRNSSAGKISLVLIRLHELLTSDNRLRTHLSRLAVSS